MQSLEIGIWGKQPAVNSTREHLRGKPMQSQPGGLDGSMPSREQSSGRGGPQHISGVGMPNKNQYLITSGNTDSSGFQYGFSLAQLGMSIKSVDRE